MNYELILKEFQNELFRPQHYTEMQARAIWEERYAFVSVKSNCRSCASVWHCQGYVTGEGGVGTRDFCTEEYKL